VAVFGWVLNRQVVDASAAPVQFFMFPFEVDSLIEPERGDSLLLGRTSIGVNASAFESRLLLAK
jgi:hypothetical protein